MKKPVKKATPVSKPPSKRTKPIPASGIGLVRDVYAKLMVVRAELDEALDMMEDLQ